MTGHTSRSKTKRGTMRTAIKRDCSASKTQSITRPEYLREMSPSEEAKYDLLVYNVAKDRYENKKSISK